MNETIDPAGDPGFEAQEPDVRVVVLPDEASELGDTPETASMGEPLESHRKPDPPKDE
jgi:hypothetical protein